MEKWIIPNAELVITKDNVQRIGEIFAIKAVQLIKRCSGSRLDRLYRGLVNDIQEAHLDGGTTCEYAYRAEGWRDQLLSYNGENFEYDAMGNPTVYRGKNLSWSHVRRLDSFDGVSYTYNVQGIRTSKTVNGVTTKFHCDGAKLLAQENGENTLYFTYGAEGVAGFTLQGEGEYLYKKNAMGDVLAIVDQSGTEIVRYVYDAWGNHKIFVLNSGNYIDISSQTVYNVDGEKNRRIANLNPIRYRGYYFDIATGLYYLQSRYYDPELGRFINADDISYLDPEMIGGLNLYSYCFNNSVNASDHGGNMPDWLKITLLSMFIPGYAIGALIGGSISAANGGGFSSGAMTGGITGSIIAGLVITTLLTGGATAGLTAALGGGFWASVGAGAIVGGISGALMGGGFSVLQQGLAVGYDSINWGAVSKAALIGGVSGAIIGGVLNGITKILTNKFTRMAQRGIQTGRKGGRFLGNTRIKVMSPNNLNFYEAGGTLIKFGNGFRIDVGTQTLLHFHIGALSAHLQFTMFQAIISGLIGGLY